MSDTSEDGRWEIVNGELRSLVPARLPASEPPSDLPRRLRAEANWLAEGYALDMTVTVAVLEEARDAIVESASTLAALRAEVEREQAKTRAMWEEREGWKRTASERGFANVALRRLAQAVCDRLPEGMDAAVDQLRAALSRPPAEGPGR